jgi:endonuclease/exonuclease/phosphatase family metal-dependent hydrolase
MSFTLSTQKYGRKQWIGTNDDDDNLLLVLVDDEGEATSFENDAKHNRVRDESGSLFIDVWVASKPSLRLFRKSKSGTNQYWKMTEYEDDTVTIRGKDKRFMSLDKKKIVTRKKKLYWTIHYDVEEDDEDEDEDEDGSFGLTVWNVQFMAGSDVPTWVTDEKKMQWLLKNSPFPGMSDVVCLVEVGQDDFDNEWLPWLTSHDYLCFYSPKAKWDDQGQVVCWKESRFDLVTTQVVDSRDNSVFVSVTLKDKLFSTSPLVEVVCVHLKACAFDYSKTFSKRRVRQWRRFVDRAVTPAIVCGDFNVNDSKGMVTTFADSVGLTRLQTSSSKTIKWDAHGVCDGVIDHVFFPDDVFSCEQVGPVINGDNVNGVSDHAPIHCRFTPTRPIQPGVLFETVSFNLGYRIMLDDTKKKSTEKKTILQCQKRFGPGPKGELPVCTQNALKLAAFHGRDLICFQEVSRMSRLWKELLRLHSGDLKRVTSDELIIAYNSDTLGTAVTVLTPSDGYDLDGRNLLAVYFKDVGLVVVNLHAPHGYADAKAFQNAITMACTSVWSSSGIGDVDHVIVCGDFNDEYKTKLTSFNAFGHKMVLPNAPPLTCCDDVDFVYEGDYIFVSSGDAPDYAFGLPPNFVHTNGSMSDHLPVVLTRK